MRKLAVVVLLLLPLATLPAQETGSAVEPQEPEMVLPEVILRIEDFSVEDVEAGVPGGGELLAPERTLPLPEVGELEIEEPEIPFDVGESRDLGAPERSSGLSAQVIVGAGTLSHLYSQISLNRIGGQEPRFKLRFLHEMLDGVAGSMAASAGSGYQIREDRLEAGGRLHLGSLGLEVEGSFQDRERGLQQQATLYDSHVQRQGKFDARLDLPVGERVTLSGRADASFAVQLLTGDDPERTTEMLLSPLASLEFRRGNIRMGLEGSYTYRAFSSGSDEELNRAGLQAFFGAEFLDDYRFEARGGWSWNSDLGHLFPFSLSVSGTPFSTFSFQASGGYRIVPVNYAGLLDGYPLPALSAGLEDDRGWFTDLGMSFTLTKNLSLQARALLALDSSSLQPDGAGPDANGLFDFTTADTRLDTDARLRWNLSSLLTLSAGLHTEFLDRAPGSPLHSGVVEIEGGNSASRWGANGRLEFAVGDPDILPLLSAGWFYNVTDTVSLITEFEDLLYPFWQDSALVTRLPSGGLYAWDPYEAPGLRGTIKVQINL